MPPKSVKSSTGSSMPAKTAPRTFAHPLLLAHLETGRLAHTYLFTGPPVSSKNDLVLAFARALNCEKKVPGTGLVPGTFLGDACGCASCGKIERGTHPDVRWFAEEEARSLKIELVREILHEASLRPYEGRWKVFVLERAERLTPEAANALLKTLEEPPAHSVFLLLVENKAHLLETVQSRAFEVRALPVPEKDPLEDPKIQLIEAGGWTAYFDALKNTSRPELTEGLETLLLYLRDRAARDRKDAPERSRRFLEFLDRAYEVLKALDANVNQKLALTYLEMKLGTVLKGTGLPQQTFSSLSLLGPSPRA